jgi:phenylalanyl-tRNA synthetase beta chain
MTYTMTSLELLRNVYAEPRNPAPLPPKIANPMTAEQEYMRSSLRPGLLATLAANRRHEDGGIKIFEIGRVYQSSGKGLPKEPEYLCGIMNGSRAERSWAGGEGAYDFYDVKGIIEGLLSKLDIAAVFEKSDDEGLHPAKQAAIVLAGKGKKTTFGVIGQVHPKVADRFESAGTVYLFEIEMDGLLAAAGQATYTPIPRYPSTVRDIALVIDDEVTNRQIMEIIKGFPLVSEAVLFDVYSGKQVAAGKKSLAYRLFYQSAEHTLIDEEVNKVQEQILTKLAKELGATLRA